MSAKKQKTILPVVIVEDHNDVLYHIYRAIGSKRLPFSDGTMIHFDSHPDLMIPKTLNAEKIYEKEHVLNSLSIENWIMPALYAGHFSTVVWMKPEWATQITNGTHHFKIGHHRSSKDIKVTCTESYFVSELAWCPAEELESARDVTLEVCTLREPQDELTSADALQKAALSPDVKNGLDGRPYLLDIDLDFYSTRNPFLSLFNEEQFNILRQLYHYQHPKELTEAALQEATSRRRQQLSDLESIFNSVRDGVPLPSSQRLEDVKALLSTFPDQRPPDPTLLNDAGCTCDDCDLPHHVSTHDQVRHLVEASRGFLASLPKPALVTVARSSRDDYCPPEDVDFIQAEVLKMLEEIYGELDVHQDYDMDASEEEVPPLVRSVSSSEEEIPTLVDPESITPQVPTQKPESSSDHDNQRTSEILNAPGNSGVSLAK